MILRRAGIGALVVSIGAVMMSNVLFLAAFQFRLDMFLEPTLILGSRERRRPNFCVDRQS